MVASVAEMRHEKDKTSKCTSWTHDDFTSQEPTRIRNQCIISILLKPQTSGQDKTQELPV